MPIPSMITAAGRADGRPRPDRAGPRVGSCRAVKESLGALSKTELDQLGKLLDAALGPDPTA